MSIQSDPMRNTFLRKESYKLRDEFSDGNPELMMTRKVKLKKLLLQEKIDHEKILRELGYAYIPTHL